MPGKSPLFVSLPFLSLSLSIRFLLYSLPVCRPSFFFFLFFFFLLFLIHRIPLSLFAPTHFLISSFSLFLHLLFFLLFWISINRMVQKWETSSPLPPLPLVILTFFLIIFFHFPLFSSCDTWLNVSHLSQFAPTHGYYFMCPAHRVPCCIHMVLPCVTRYLEKREISTVS